MTRLVHPLRRGAVELAGSGSRLLFPLRCARCDVELPAAGHDPLLCADCCLVLAPELWPGCPLCGAAGFPDGGPPGRCGLCREAPLEFDTAIPLGYYDTGLRSAVLRMKQPTNDFLSAAIGRLLALRRGPRLADLKTDLIVPVPMYWTRRLRRGTNSPEVLTGSLGKSLGIPVARRVLSRCRNTRPQADLLPEERFRNVRGAFCVRAGWRFDGVRVLLVDDILTTGATCSEAAKMLKRAGAEVVAVAVVARAQGPNWV